MNVCLFGASGMVGAGTLLECLDDPRVASVLVVGRTPCGVKHPKVTEVLHRGFTDFTALTERFRPIDACFFCLGVSSAGMREAAYSAITYVVTIAAARALRNEDVCFVGIGQPSAAANLARLTHAPDITLIYESGTLSTKPNVLPLSIGDPELCETALTTVSVPEMFRYWLQGGRITVGFLGGGGFFALGVSAKGVDQIEAAIEFGGNLSLNLGIASGGVYIMAGIYFKMTGNSLA